MLLDTNAISAILSGDKAVARILEFRQTPHLPAVVIGEYRYGLLRSKQRPRLSELLEALIEACTVLAIDSDTARAYATVRNELRTAGTPIPENDVWIAALARQHQLPVLSKDTHFDAVDGLQRLSW